MKRLNPQEKEIAKKLEKTLKQTIKESKPEEIRNLFGEELKNAQERVKKIIS